MASSHIPLVLALLASIAASSDAPAAPVGITHGRGASAGSRYAYRSKGLVLERLGEVSVEVDGQPRPAVGWRLDAAPGFLATIPRELLARGADPATGRVDLVLRVGANHPAVARTEAMIARMHQRWSNPSPRPGMRVRPQQFAPLPADDCVEACKFYSCDGAGNLFDWRPEALGAGLIGNMGVTMFDLAVTVDLHLYGLSGGDLYLVNACTAEVTLLGPSSLAGGLCADFRTGGLIASGPPLEEIPLPSTLPVPIGGSCCGAPPSWCGPSWGDIAESERVDRLYAALPCPGCGGDALVTIDSTDGAMIDMIGCLEDDQFVPQPIGGVTGITFNSSCFCDRLTVGTRDSDLVYSVDPATGRAFNSADLGPLYSGTFGFASTPEVTRCSNPPSCDPAAEPAACASVQLHANASDPDRDELTYSWTTTCPGASFSPSASDPDPLATVDAGCGACTFDLVVADGNGGTCSDSVEVSFDDVTPPIVEASALVECAWPPSHGLVDVGLTATASDDCTDAASIALSIASVTSDEATATAPGAGGAGHSPDAVVNGLSVKVRAERSGDGDGRAYRITLRAVDACGNEGEAIVEVHVPHDRGARSRRDEPEAPCAAIDSGQIHDATARN